MNHSTPNTLEAQARRSPEDARLVAENPAAPSALLERLAGSKDPLILARLAQNPNTPKHTLFQLARRFPAQVLENPAFPLLLLEHPDALRTEIDADAARAFLSLSDCADEMFSIVASHKDTAVRLEAASHPKTPTAVLLSMKGDQAWAVVDALVKNPNTPGEVIARLLEYSSDGIRVLAAKHPNAPAARLLLFQRAGVSFEPEPYTYGSVFRLRQPQRLTLEELSTLAQGSDFCRQIAALHPDTPRTLLLSLAQDPAQMVQVAVASNPNIDPDIIALLNTKEYYLQLALCQNPATPTELLASFVPKANHSLCKYLIQNPNLSAESTALFLTHEEPSVRLLAARSPKAPPALLALLRRAGASEDLSSLEADPKAPLSDEDLALLWDAGPFAKQLLARRPDTSRELLSRLALMTQGQDPSGLIAAGLLRNPMLPTSFLCNSVFISSHSLQLTLASRADIPPELLAHFLDSSIAQCRATAAFHRSAPTDMLCLLWRAGASPDLSETYPPTADITETELVYLSERGFFSKLLAAQHPKTPIPLIEKLSKCGEYWVHVALLKNHNTTEAAIRNLPVSYGDICRLLAAHPNTPADILRKLVADNFQESRANAAAHPNLGAAELALLARDPSRRVRDAVAQNPNTPTETLEWLALEPRAALRLCLAKNVASPPHVLQTLALDPAPNIRVIAQQNPSLPTEFLVLLRCVEALEPSLTSEQLEEFFSWGGISAVMLVEHPRCSAALLTKLSETATRAMRLKIAAHPNTPAALLQRYQTSLAPTLRAAVAKNPARPAAETPFPKDPAWTRYTRAMNPLTEPSQLSALADAPEIQTREALAMNPATTPLTVEALSRDAVFVVRLATARRADASASLLRALSTDRHIKVRIAVARHSSTPAGVLSVLADDKKVKVRRAVIQNQQTPIETREKLAQDRARRVRARCP